MSFIIVSEQCKGIRFRLESLDCNIVRQKIELHSKPHLLTDCIPCPTACTVVSNR